ncbi:MAG TPA: MFS transporter [Clostridiales bacterium]|nr:MFS transporter [Clostridiales bacterium]
MCNNARFNVEGIRLNRVLSKFSDFFHTTFRALQYRNFRLFWFGQCISLTGTWMQRTAQTWLVYTVTNSPIKVGLVGVFQFTPMLLFSLFAGVLADRIPKKRLLILTQTVFMLQAVIMTLLTFSGRIQYWHILLLSMLFGFTQTLDMPARQSFFIELVGPENLTNAISLNSTIVNLAKIVGPAVSGFVMVQCGMTVCFFINAVSFLPVIAGILLIRVEKTPVHRANAHILPEIVDGIRYIGRNDTLILNVLITAVVCTFAMNNDVIIPIFAREVLGRGADGYSSLMAAAGFGAFVGAVTMAYRSKFGVKKSLLIFSGAASALLQVLTIFSHQYWMSAVLIAGIGFNNLVFMNMANSIFQINSSNDYRGRVMSVYSFLNQGSTPIGNFLSGLGMEYFGGGSGFVFCGVTTATLLCAVLFVKRSSLKNWLPRKNAT